MHQVQPSSSPAIVGRRMQALREGLGWSQEKVGVEIGLEESASRMRISRYERGVHEPPVGTARLIARVFGVPLAYLYCEDDEIAALLLALHKRPPDARREVAKVFIEALESSAT
ncbi:helix-turn-helix domain-containing protein [Acidovorax sp. A1169]|uniref:helix-turn-helix domain-containing protein n=1 Tax=Acidovorax sp. A1169 TaxID=3059524 RepID=UPI002737FDBD|nr:helix-turn-helix transcriptional regulator [Acidovorax sp. A1169]MDP4075178.1 helix-turn-helix transcriptional regulator [Acidovorax sp. A1169]